MLTLRTVTNSRWLDDPFIARVTMNANLPKPLRIKEALFIRELAEAPPVGFKAYLTTDQNIYERFKDQIKIILLDVELNHLSEGDVFKFSPHEGLFKVLYRVNARPNFFLVTERCNNYCLMCSQPPRDIDDDYITQDILEVIPLMSKGTPEVMITGGEPTLLGKNLLAILTKLKNFLPNTAVHILSNGRLFYYLSLARDIAALNHPDLMIGIPVYSDISNIHDYVVQADGAFDETIRGIINLKRYNVPVEVRVVIHKATFERLPQLARFISRNLPMVDQVALMGLEITGFTKANLKALWIDPTEYQDHLKLAVEEFSRNKIKVSIYNHQLCLLDPSLWVYSVKSISDWKNEYFEQCGNCDVLERCGGFFSSSSIKHSEHIKPISLVVK